MTQENKDRMISGLTTFVVMLLSIVLCSWLGYKLPNPPIEEEGMGVAGEVLGEIEGLGNNDEATFDDNSASSPSSSAPEESYTTSEEPTPVAKTPKSEEKPTPSPPKESVKTPSNNSNASQTETPKPTTNPNASFPRRNRNATGGEGKGTATGSGQQGSPDGTQGAQGGEGKGIGADYRLGSRGLSGTLPVPPKKQRDKQGDVVVEIWVDREGNVVDVNAPAKGSTIYDKTIVEEAKQAASKAHFSKDPNAKEKEKGTITYYFRW